MHDSIRSLGLATLFAALLIPSQGFAQEQDEGESVRTSRLGLVIPPEIRSQKRRHAKKGDWAWTLAAATSAGYDSNLHLSPSNEQDTAVQELHAKIGKLTMEKDFLAKALGGGPARGDP